MQVLVLLACVYAGKVGYGYLMDTANKVYLSHSEIQAGKLPVWRPMVCSQCTGSRLVPESTYSGIV